MKYLGTHILILFGTVISYAAICALSPVIFIVLLVLFHIVTLIVLIILAYVDPGIMPKILPGYEREELKNIPIDPRY